MTVKCVFHSEPLTFGLSILVVYISILETVHISVNALALDRQMIADENEIFRKTLL